MVLFLFLEIPRFESAVSGNNLCMKGSYLNFILYKKPKKVDLIESVFSKVTQFFNLMVQFY